MRIIDRLSRQFAADEAHQRCTVARNSNDSRILRRLYINGVLVRPYYRMYARAEYWKSLDPRAQMQHMVITAQAMHPSWVFARESAACMFPSEQSFGIYAPQELVIMSKLPPQTNDHKNLHRLPWESSQIITIDNVRVTSSTRTLFDCGMKFAFEHTLPLFDSFVQHGVDLDRVRDICVTAKEDTSRIQRLIEFTDPLAENGGESRARAVIIDSGFMPPILQHQFVNPRNPRAPLRSDFLWYGPNGAVIVGEYDGMGKYGTEYSQISEHVARQAARDKILMEQGVTAIVHFTYTDVVNPERLRAKLEAAGVPYRGSADNRGSTY
ncbi:hypothetical protein [Bifidobacterium canis]|uniref:CTP synthase n=1 Tax=Bifidobacterium canis TaxID=2610880 RepID=A0A7K1J2M6_9BIFI|nr:hypothetical protein [Bifidobacterium canis]MUH58810.1 hypothetical protein [Bifidobacterium canis]